VPPLAAKTPPLHGRARRHACLSPLGMESGHECTAYHRGGHKGVFSAAAMMRWRGDCQRSQSNRASRACPAVGAQVHRDPEAPASAGPLIGAAADTAATWPAPTLFRGGLSVDLAFQLFRHRDQKAVRFSTALGRMARRPPMELRPAAEIVQIRHRDDVLMTLGRRYQPIGSCRRRSRSTGRTPACSLNSLPRMARRLDQP
jgi:hypothetical protein